MPNYAYTIRDATMAIIEGSAESENIDVLRKRLGEQGFDVIDIKQIKTVGKKRVGGYGGVKGNDLAIMCRQFSTMIDAGVSLVRCLSVLGDQISNPKLRAIVADLKVEVEGGQMLAKAMEKYPNVFDRLFVGLVRAGEVGGTLEESLQRLSQFLEKDVELRRKVKAALTYPMIVVTFALLVVLLLMTFILPKFIEMFDDLGIKDLPGPTAFLDGISKFIITKWYWGIAIVVVTVVALKTFGKNESWQKTVR